METRRKTTTVSSRMLGPWSIAITRTEGRNHSRLRLRSLLLRLRLLICSRQRLDILFLKSGLQPSRSQLLVASRLLRNRLPMLLLVTMHIPRTNTASRHSHFKLSSQLPEANGGPGATWLTGLKKNTLIFLSKRLNLN